MADHGEAGYRSRAGSGNGGVRERLIRVGAETVSAPELLSVVLGEGRRDEDTVALARSLLRAFGGIRRTASRTVPELMTVRGIGRGRATRLVAVFALLRAWAEESLPRGMQIRTSADVFERFHPILRDRKREVFLSILLDGKNRVLREDRVSVGSLTASIVHPREVFATAIRESADGIVFVHNHPSGDPTPSVEDVEITERLTRVSRLVGIRVLDHVVIGDGCYTSFHEKGLID